MRTVKRVFLSIGEAGALLLGVVISFSLAVYVDELLKPREEIVPLGTLFAGLVLSVVAATVLRHKHRARKFAYDVASWEVIHDERKLHPRRARAKRLALQTLPWSPSIFAAFWLFFFPVASHLFHPGSQYLRHYRVPIPWGVTVFSMPGLAREGTNWVEALVMNRGRSTFGMTPNWRREEPSSIMTFGNLEPGYSYSLDSRPTAFGRQFLHLTKMELHLRDVPLVCWQYEQQPATHGLYVIGPWEVQCGTTDAARERNLYARFSGEAADLPLFYRIIEGVTSVN